MFALPALSTPSLPRARARAARAALRYSPAERARVACGLEKAIAAGRLSPMRVERALRTDAPDAELHRLGARLAQRAPFCAQPVPAIGTAVPVSLASTFCEGKSWRRTIMLWLEAMGEAGALGWREISAAARSARARDLLPRLLVEGWRRHVRDTAREFLDRTGAALRGSFDFELTPMPLLNWQQEPADDYALYLSTSLPLAEFWPDPAEGIVDVRLAGLCAVREHIGIPCVVTIGELLPQEDYWIDELGQGDDADPAAELASIWEMPREAAQPLFEYALKHGSLSDFAPTPSAAHARAQLRAARGASGALGRWAATVERLCDALGAMGEKVKPHYHDDDEYSREPLWIVGPELDGASPGFASVYCRSMVEQGCQFEVMAGADVRSPTKLAQLTRRAIVELVAIHVATSSLPE